MPRIPRKPEGGWFSCGLFAHSAACRRLGVGRCYLAANTQTRRHGDTKSASGPAGYVSFASFAPARNPAPESVADLDSPPDPSVLFVATRFHQPIPFLHAAACFPPDARQLGHSSNRRPRPGARPHQPTGVPIRSASALESRRLAGEVRRVRRRRAAAVLPGAALRRRALLPRALEALRRGRTRIGTPPRPGGPPSSHPVERDRGLTATS